MCLLIQGGKANATKPPNSPPTFAVIRTHHTANMDVRQEGARQAAAQNPALLACPYSPHCFGCGTNPATVQPNPQPSLISTPPRRAATRSLAPRTNRLGCSLLPRVGGGSPCPLHKSALLLTPQHSGGVWAACRFSALPNANINFPKITLVTPNSVQKKEKKPYTKLPNRLFSLFCTCSKKGKKSRFFPLFAAKTQYTSNPNPNRKPHPPSPHNYNINYPFYMTISAVHQFPKHKIPLV